MRDPKAPRIADLEHYVALCTTKDVIVDGATMELRREAVVWTWARIQSYYGFPMFHSPAGYAVLDPRTKITHGITVRLGLNIEVTSAAWVYEEPLKTPPRWYKVLGFSEPGQHVVLMVRLQEKSDAALPPLSDLSPQPSRVEL